MSKVIREFVFTDDRPFESCHASTALPLVDGTLLVAWFAGPHEKHPDTAIWLSRRDDAGRWTSPGKIADEIGVAHWNPVLAYSPEGEIRLFYKVGLSPGTWSTRAIGSDNNGLSWGHPEDVGAVDGFPAGPVKNKPIVLADSTWIAPTSLETEDAWDCAVTMSRDNGGTWSLGGPVPLNHRDFAGKGLIQPTLWESKHGTVHMLMRSTAGRIYRSDSSDGGRTWCAAYATSLPNNNSGIDLAQLESGILAVCYNPVEDNWGKRTPLHVTFSANNGEDWGNSIVLEDEDPPSNENAIVLDEVKRPNEFSYPALVRRGDDLVATYTWKRERIACCFITVPTDSIQEP